MTALLPEVTDTGRSDDSLDHLYCCDVDISMCGKDISGYEDFGPDMERGSDTCVVCELTEKCRICGHEYPR